VGLELRDRGDGTVVLEVSDDGCGLSGAEPGVGMRGMAERALLIDAELEISSMPGTGTRLRLEVPAGAVA
jgi:two-component system sensor histidine kinase UhpB